MKLLSPSCLAGLIFLLSTQIALADCLPNSLYLTRHAEKQDEKGNRDPNLSEQGQARALRIANMFEHININYLFSTPYHRTKQTLTPLSQSKNLAITEYDPREQDAFITQLKNNYCGQTLVIAGHSNTVPDMLQDLGIHFNVSIGKYRFKYQPSIILSEHEFGQMFFIRFDNDTPVLEILNSDS
ncbi:SixA phosphatase family protein [Shewanella surugensis]|uniref:Histidine phosphatase family protein n=1 Tax=Shewanella surugensis TaxID=212020 RepID=A0ABT0LD29_9GAMM|nr:phosphoglycerate mutase family protein [Shewanella surugensis]MCL1125612.1 histidine phosphatase family protein [Shewanella surugensis]